MRHNKSVETNAQVHPRALRALVLGAAHCYVMP
jgi:hypothetical protein